MLLFSLWLAVQAAASQPIYDLDLKLIEAGKTISMPHLSVMGGSHAFIEQRSETGRLFLDIKPKRTRLGILLRLALGHVSIDGEKTVEARPHLLLLDGVPSQVAVKGKAETLLAATAREISTYPTP